MKLIKFRKICFLTLIFFIFAGGLFSIMYFSNKPVNEIEPNSQIVSAAESHVHDGHTWTPASTISEMSTANAFYYLTNDITLTETWIINYNVLIDLNGYDLVMKSGVYGPVIRIENYANVAIYDCQDTDEDPNDGGCISGGQTGSVNVGTAESPQYEIKEGCGIWLYDGILNIYGGNICNNGNQFTGNGGGIRIDGQVGSGDRPWPPIVVLNGGTIHSNTAGFGSAVYLNSGTHWFVMHGGAIRNNNALSAAAVYVSNGSFGMDGGYISNNTANGNTSMYHLHAGGVALGAGYVKLANQVQINNNTYQGNPSNLLLNETSISANADGLTEGSQIGLTTLGSAYVSSDAASVKYFVADDPEKTIQTETDPNNSVRIKVVPVSHTHSFDANGVCSCGDHQHTYDQTYLFSKWVSTTSLPTSSGNYVLSSNVVLDRMYKISNVTINLDLGGYSVTSTSDYKVIVGSGAVLNLFSCSLSAIDEVLIDAGGTFNIKYGGSAYKIEYEMVNNVTLKSGENLSFTNTLSYNNKLYIPQDAVVNITTPTNKYIILQVNGNQVLNGSPYTTTFTMPRQTATLTGSLVELSAGAFAVSGKEFDSFASGDASLNLLQGTPFTIHYDLDYFYLNNPISFDFSQNLPVGSRLILSDVCSTHATVGNIYYYTASNSVSSVAFTDFKKMGTNTNYVEISECTATNVKYQLCIEIPSVMTNLKILLKQQGNTTDYAPIIVNLTNNTGVSLASISASNGKISSQIIVTDSNNYNKTLVVALKKDNVLINFTELFDVNLTNASSQEVSKTYRGTYCIYSNISAGTYSISIENLPAGSYKLIAYLSVDPADSLYPMNDIKAQTESTTLTVAELLKPAINIQENSSGNDYKIVDSLEQAQITFNVQTVGGNSLSAQTQIKSSGAGYHFNYANTTNITASVVNQSTDTTTGITTWQITVNIPKGTASGTYRVALTLDTAVENFNFIVK